MARVKNPAFLDRGAESVVAEAKKAAQQEKQAARNAVADDYEKQAEKEIPGMLSFVVEGAKYEIPHALSVLAYKLQGQMTDNANKWRNSEPQISEQFGAGDDGACYNAQDELKYKALTRFLQLSNPNYRAAFDVVDSLGKLNKRGGPGLTNEQSDQYYGATARLKTAERVISQVRQTLYRYWKERQAALKAGTGESGASRESTSVGKMVDRFKAAIGKKADSSGTADADKKLAQRCVFAMTWIQGDADAFETAYLQWVLKNRQAPKQGENTAREAATEAAIKAAAANAH